MIPSWADDGTVPLYRFVRIEEVYLQDAHSSFSMSFELNDTITVLYSRVYYKLHCEGQKVNDVDHYLGVGAYSGTSNITGFFRYEPVSEQARLNIVGEHSYRSLADTFRIRATSREGTNRNVFVTSMEPIVTHVARIPTLDLRLGKSVVIKHIHCPDSGIGDVTRINMDRIGQVAQQLRRKRASCDHDMYPSRGCPADSIATELGNLMPESNSQELNIIGKSGDTWIPGILIYGIVHKNPDGTTVVLLLDVNDRNNNYRDSVIDEFLARLYRKPDILMTIIPPPVRPE